MVEGKRTEEYKLILRIHKVILQVSEEMDCNVEWSRGQRTAKTKAFKLKPGQRDIKLGEKFQFSSQIEFDSNN